MVDNSRLNILTNKIELHDNKINNIIKDNEKIMLIVNNYMNKYNEIK
jgi:hypothetical protein